METERVRWQKGDWQEPEGVGNGELWLNGYRVSAWEDEKGWMVVMSVYDNVNLRNVTEMGIQNI